MLEYSGSFVVSHKFGDFLKKILKKYHWDFEREYIKSVDYFVLYGHFNSVNINLPSSWAENIFPFIYISSISFIIILWFSVYRSFPSLVKFIPKHFILSDAILKFIFPRWFSGKESIWQAGDLGSIPASGRYPGEGHGNPLQYSSLGDPMDRGAWVGCSPWGLKESGTSQWLNSNSSKVSLLSFQKISC